MPEPAPTTDTCWSCGNPVERDAPSMLGSRMAYATCTACASRFYEERMRTVRRDAVVHESFAELMRRDEEPAPRRRVAGVALFFAIVIAAPLTGGLYAYYLCPPLAYCWPW